MNLTITNTSSTSLDSLDRPSPGRRFFGVVADPQTYRHLAYLLLGLPLGTIWFTVLVTGIAVGASTLAVALLGVPILLGMWYVSRMCANAERGVANALVGQGLPHAPVRAGHTGNVWRRLRAMTGERARWRELAYLLARFPAGIATFTAAVALPATAASIAWAPFAARVDDDQPFGDWTYADRLEDIASSPWSWLLVPLAALVLVVSLHLLNALARACGRWTASALGEGATAAHRG